jgi:hypothetical protein
MRQRLAIILSIVLVVLVLIGLNAASYAPVEKEPENEFRPDRSTYNAGPTGTRALYDFLTETKRKVVRWRERPAALTATGGKTDVTTFVVVGTTLRPFDKDDIINLMRWVNLGGRLVVIDRSPDWRLLPSSGNWRISTEPRGYGLTADQPDNPEAITEGVSPAHPSQPAIFTYGVDQIIPSRLAAIVKISSTTETSVVTVTAPTVQGGSDDEEDDSADEEEPPPPPPPVRQRRTDSSPPPKPSPTPSRPATGPGTGSGMGPGPVSGVGPGPKRSALPISPAPVVYLAGQNGALLVDYPHGYGRIVLLSDPFIVTNDGINRGDNLRLALNLVGGSEGLIAFDEYHQGHGLTQNQLVRYFSGTPVLALLAQAGFLVALFLWTRGRRLARPLPLPTIDRRSSLEFVSSMAELQQRARAYDLALENIYTRTRRALVRYAGVGHKSPRTEVASRVAARARLDKAMLESLMRHCEEVINGAPISAAGAVQLAGRLREIELSLGILVRSREMKQAKEKAG